MNANPQLEWLTMKIADLPFTGQFKKISGELSFVTLGDMVKKEVAALIVLPGFSYHMLQELVQFLEEKELADLLEQ